VAAVVNIRRLHRAFRADDGAKGAQTGQEKGARAQSQGQEQGLFSFMCGLWHALTTFLPRRTSPLACVIAW